MKVATLVAESQNLAFSCSKLSENLRGLSVEFAGDHASVQNLASGCIDLGDALSTLPRRINKNRDEFTRRLSAYPPLLRAFRDSLEGSAFIISALEKGIKLLPTDDGARRVCLWDGKVVRANELQVRAQEAALDRLIPLVTMNSEVEVCHVIDEYGDTLHEIFQQSGKIKFPDSGGLTLLKKKPGNNSSTTRPISFKLAKEPSSKLTHSDHEDAIMSGLTGKGTPVATPYKGESDVPRPEPSVDGRLILTAARDGIYSTVRRLTSGSDEFVEITDENGMSALHHSAEQGHSSIVELLLQNEADALQPNSAGQLALHLASKGGHEQISTLLLENRSSAVGVRDVEWRMPLHHATINGHVRVMEALLTSSAPINALTRDCKSPLMLAIESENTDAVKLLLRSGADISIRCKDQTALAMSIVSARYNMTEVLLKEQGIALPAPEDESRTALHIAAVNGETLLINLLLDSGVPVDITTKLEQSTPLMTAAYRGQSDIMRQLIYRGADIECQDQLGYTPLCHAVLGHQVSCADILLQDGSSLDVCENQGHKMPIHFAAASGDWKMVNLLLSNGASVRTKSGEGLSALEYGKNSSEPLVVEIMTASLNRPH